MSEQLFTADGKSHPAVPGAYIEQKHVRARAVKGWAFEDLPDRRRSTAAKFATGELR